MSKSRCCQAELDVAGGSEGTYYYVCFNCGLAAEPDFTRKDKDNDDDAEGD